MEKLPFKPMEKTLRSIVYVTFINYIIRIDFAC